MKTTRYLVHTSGDQSLLALAFVTEDAAAGTADILILPVNLMRPADAPPIVDFSAKLTKKLRISGTHESMCEAVLKESGISPRHQMIFYKIPAP
jgi:hypothetical protein